MRKKYCTTLMVRPNYARFVIHMTVQNSQFSIHIKFETMQMDIFVEFALVVQYSCQFASGAIFLTKIKGRESSRIAHNLAAP